jgi:hypothetical protein
LTFLIAIPISLAAMAASDQSERTVVVSIEENWIRAIAEVFAQQVNSARTVAPPQATEKR